MAPGQASALMSLSSVVNRVTLTGVLMLAGAASVWAQELALPRSRPTQPTINRDLGSTPKPSTCRLRLTGNLAIALSLPPITGPGECLAPDVVRLEKFLMPETSPVTLMPPAILRCSMAEAVVSWVREELGPAASKLGSPPRSIGNLDSFDCRGRNQVVGAKISEHGKANAIDMQSVTLFNGKTLELTDPHVPKEFRETLRQSMCARFTTVLGPGSDGYHENHVHIDLIERRNEYRICQWDIHDADQASETPSVPSPVPRPFRGIKHNGR
jgi:hypothetical protein